MGFMNTQTQDLPLASVRDEGMALARPQPTVADMLQAVIEKGVTQENVAAVGEIVKLYERMEDKKAEKAFATAFVALQAEMPTIVAKSVIPNRGRYEKFEDVMETIGPLLQKHGLSVSFSNDAKDNRITETCHLMHIEGHSRSNEFSVRVGRADSETQADCKAATTAKRNALLNALNIVIRQDVLQDETDARNEGGPISEDQAFELERRVKETNSDVAAFLRVAGAAHFAAISSAKYEMLDGMLTRKEKAR